MRIYSSDTFDLFVHMLQQELLMWPLLLTWFNLNLSMDK